MDVVENQQDGYTNEEKIAKAFEELSFLAFQTEEEVIVEHEQRLADLILSLSEDNKSENSELTQPFHLYLHGLYLKGRISLDKSTHNKSIEFFTDSLIDNVDTYKAVFQQNLFQKVILMTILANLSIHRVQHANKVLEAYDSIFSQPYKAWVYLKILSATCGILDLKRIEELFNRAEEAYQKECTSTQAKASFFKNLYVISKGAECPIPNIDAMSKDLQSRLLHDSSNYAVELYREYMSYNEYLEETEEWLNSLQGTVGKPIEQIRDRLESRKAGLKELPIHVKYDKPKVEDLDSKNSAIRKNMQDKEFPLSTSLADIDECIEYYHNMSSSSQDVDSRIRSSNLYYSLSLLRLSVNYWKLYEENYKKVVPGNDDAASDVVFLFANEHSLVDGAVTFPFLLEARRRGAKCYSICPRIHLDSCDENDEFYELYGKCTGAQDIRFYADKDISDTVIDIPNKKILVDGLNVFQPVFEFVSRYQFTYYYKFETDAWARYKTTYIIRVFRSLFQYIEKIEEWAKRNKKTVYFISNAPHLHIAAAFRIYCEERGYKNGLYYICTSPGYDNYFANASDPRSETTTALNLTTHPYARNSFLGTKEGFEDYYQRNVGRIEEIRSRMRKHLEAQRGRKNPCFNPSEKERIIETITTAKKEGKKVLLLNGKVIIDLAVKYTKGCVHSDMSEWITHAVQFSKEHDDKILLLIKPHPHENREDLTLTSEKIDNLRSLIKTDLGENTIYLDNDMFANHELIDYMDLGMVWNGTSALEFAAQGKKTLVADVWGHYDYPIGFVFPKTLAEYEGYMLDPESIVEDKEISDKAVTFLEYMGSEDVRITNHYSQTTLMNFNQYESTVDSEAVERFVSEGDAELEAYFDKVFAGTWPKKKTGIRALLSRLSTALRRPSSPKSSQR